MARYDVVVVGGGPAGLSAATVLGRCRRRVLVCDAGRPRNASSSAMHCYLGRDGIAPHVFLETARAELRTYPSVEIAHGKATAVRAEAQGFVVDVEGRGDVQARKLLLATGVVDCLPPIAGIEQLYGKSVHHCPYCDGFEHTGEAMAAYGRGEKGAGLALMLRLWSSDVVLLTDGPAELARDRLDHLASKGIVVQERRVTALEGKAGRLDTIVLGDGTRLFRTCLFFNTGQLQRSPLLLQLGCKLADNGGIATCEHEETSVPGVYAAGDASRDVQLVIVAAAEGATAAKAINGALLAEDGLC